MAGGLISTSTGEETDDFLCLDCDRAGSPEEFIKALEELQARGPTVEETEHHWVSGVSQFETADGRGSEENPTVIEEEEPETGVEQSAVSSDLRMPEEILPFLTLDLPTRELEILLYLQIRGYGISAKEISEELQIPEKNVHRYLAGLEKKHLIYSEGKPKCFLRIEDSQLMGRFRRRLLSSDLRTASMRGKKGHGNT